MTITAFYPFIDKIVKGASIPCKLSDFKDQTIILDGNAFLYKFRYGNRPHTHIQQFGWLITDCSIYNIKLIVVFDGKNPDLKDDENQRRKEEKIRFIEQITKSQADIKRVKIENGFDPSCSIDSVNTDSLSSENQEVVDQIRNMEDDLEAELGGRVFVLPEHRTETMEFLKHMGVWVIQAEGEGEGVCALMNRLGYADHIAADDADVFPFGGKSLVRNIGWKGKRELKMRRYDIQQILKDIGLDRSSMIEMTILCENDYNKLTRIRGIGPKNAYTIIKEHSTVENFIEFKSVTNCPRFILML
jgi:5'-3' exonuclease